MAVENIKTIKCKLLKAEKQVGGYEVYVFWNINSKDCSDEYLMCTRLPNWNACELTEGDIGYLKYQEVIAGSSKWYDSQSGTMIPYKYNGIYLLDFIKDKPKTGDIVL